MTYKFNEPNLLNVLIEKANKANASDIYLTEDRSPTMKVDGHIEQLDSQVITKEIAGKIADIIDTLNSEGTAGSEAHMPNNNEKDFGITVRNGARCPERDAPA